MSTWAGELFLDTLAAILEVLAERLALHGVPVDANAQPQPSAREGVRRGRLLGDERRLARGRMTMPVASWMRRVTPAQNRKRTKGSWKACRYVYWLSQPPRPVGVGPDHAVWSPGSRAIFAAFGHDPARSPVRISSGFTEDGKRRREGRLRTRIEGEKATRRPSIGLAGPAGAGAGVSRGVRPPAGIWGPACRLGRVEDEVTANPVHPLTLPCPLRRELGCTVTLLAELDPRERS